LGWCAKNNLNDESSSEEDVSAKIGGSDRAEHIEKESGEVPRDPQRRIEEDKEEGGDTTLSPVRVFESTKEQSISQTVPSTKLEIDAIAGDPAGKSVESILVFPASASKRTDNARASAVDMADERSFREMIENSIAAHDLLTEILNDRISHAKVVRDLWNAGDLRGASLYLLQAGNNALSIDFLQRIKSRTVRESPDPFGIAEAVVPITERLLSSRFEHYVLVALGTLQNVVVELLPECAKRLAKIDNEPCDVTADSLLKVNVFMKNLSRLLPQLDRLAVESKSSTVSARCSAIVRRVRALGIVDT